MRKQDEYSIAGVTEYFDYRRTEVDLMREDRVYICIDLKSFYASVECVERGLDPFTTDLVVADPDRSVSTICLAITPSMKKKGVKNRCRIHEIPAGMKYITAIPRMQLYIDYSARIYGIYLSYVAAEDIHVYSIDECFIDVTAYLDLYGVTAREMALMLMKAVMDETGITATAGVGSNMYLAKVAMDIVAKHVDDHIGILDEYSFRERLWQHQPLSDFWQIGNRTQRKLNQYGIYTMEDIARMSLVSERWFFQLFGIDAELMIDHAWGYESCRMEDIKSYRSKAHSLSHGQVLMRNYSFREARVVVKEMTDLLVLEMVEKGLVSDSFGLWISYDHKTGIGSTGSSISFEAPVNSSEDIIASIAQAYDKTTFRHVGIRRIGITANRVRQEGFYQFHLFRDPLRQKRERDLQRCLIRIKKRYGKNAVMRACNLLDCSTYRMRNEQIGGHRR